MADFNSFLNTLGSGGTDAVPSFGSFLNTLANAPTPPAPPPPNTSNWLTSSIGAGTYGGLSLAGRGLQAGAQLFGADEAAKAIGDWAERQHQTEKTWERPDLEEHPWSPTGILYNIGKMIPMGAAAIGGGALATLAAPEEAVGATVAAGLSAAARYRLAGAAGTMFLPAAGGNVQRQIDETGQLTEPGKALALGVPEAVVQGWLPGRVESLFGKGIMRGIAHGAATQGTAAGATEFLTQQMGDPNRSFADRASAIVTQALSGAGLGGIIGGVAGAFHRTDTTPPGKVTNKDITDKTDPALGLGMPPEAKQLELPLPPVPEKGELEQYPLFAPRAPVEPPAPPAPPTPGMPPEATQAEMALPRVPGKGELGELPLFGGKLPEPPAPPPGAPEAPAVQMALPLPRVPEGLKDLPLFARRAAEATEVAAREPPVPAPESVAAPPAAEVPREPGPGVPPVPPTAPGGVSGEPGAIRAGGAEAVPPTPGAPPGELPTVAPDTAGAVPAEPAAAPAPVLNFTARVTQAAIKKGMARIGALPLEAQAAEQQRLIDTINALKGKKIPAGLRAWGKAFGIMTEDGKELLPEFVPVQPPEVPPGVEPEALTPEAAPAKPPAAAPAAPAAPDDLDIPEFLRRTPKGAPAAAAAAPAEPAPAPAATPAGWRPVGPDEVFQPGRQFRMNVDTGQSEVFEPGTPAASVVSEAPIETPDQRLATLNGIQAKLADLPDSPAKKKSTKEADAIMRMLSLAETNPGLAKKVDLRTERLRSEVEAVSQPPADQVAVDEKPSPRAEATPAPMGDLDKKLAAARTALGALLSKGRDGLGGRTDAIAALAAHKDWLENLGRAPPGPEALRAALAKDPELFDPNSEEDNTLGGLGQISKSQEKTIGNYLAAHGAVLEELRNQTDSRARVVSRDGMSVSQMDTDVASMGQRGVHPNDVASHIAEHTTSPEEAAIVSKLQEALPEDIKLGFRDGVTDKEGEYFPKSKTIMLYNAANSTATFIHEMVHAVMHQALEGSSVAAKTMRGIYDQLKDIGNHAGITDAHEMVAEAMANPVYREFLKSQFVKGTSLWDRFVDAARDFIGLDPRLYNAFDRIMSLGDDLMKEQRNYPNGDWVGPNSYTRVTDRAVENATNRADQARDTLFQQLKDWTLGKGPDMRNAVRKGAFVGLDGYRLGELWGHAVASMRPYVDVLSKEDTRKGVLLKGSQRGQDLANTLGDDGQALLNKALTATFNGMDPREPASIEVSQNPVLSAVHREFSDAYKQLISMPNGEAAYEALRANMSTYHNIGLLDKLQTVERGLSGYTAPDRMNAFDKRTDIHADPVRTERFAIDAVKSALDSLTAYREQLTGQKVTIGGREMSVNDAVKLQQAVVDASNKTGGASDDALKTLKDLKQQSADMKETVGSINNALKDVANQRDATAKSPYFHIGRRGNFFGTAKLALGPDGKTVDQEVLAKFIEHLDNNGFADIAPMRGGEHDTFYARVKNVSEMIRLEQVLRDAQKQGLLSPGADNIGSGEATQVFGSIASDSMRKAIGMMRANRPDVPEGVDPDAFNKAFDEQIKDTQRMLLDMTSENSASRLLAQRRNVQGFDRNMIKSQRDAAMVMSSHLARMTTAWEQGELMGKMRDEVKAINHSDVDANTKLGASQAVGELMLRDALRSAYVPHNPVDAVRHITHTAAVGSSSAYFAMLMSQVLTTGLPELMKTHGIAAVPAMLRAMPKTMRIISAMAKSPERFSGEITYDALKADEVDQPTIDETMGNVARGKLVPAYSIAQTERSMPGAGITRTIVQAADAIGKYAELIPRLIVSFAARDLYENHGGYEHPLFGKMTADQFVDRAMDESQGAWGGSLTPRYASARGGFFGAATPMIDQFMGWQLRMSGKLYQEVSGMFDERTRPEATRWLMGHAAATMFFAGTLGLPLASVAASVYDRFANWVTGRDDNDITASYRNFLTDTFGNDMGEVIARGAPRAVGMDFEHWGESTIFPGSTAINILFEKRKFEDAERDWAKSMAGAGIGEMANVYLAARDAYNGDYLNGLIRMAPEILKAPAEAYRLGQYGFVNNLTGQKLPITANGWDVLKTGLGIDPGKYAEYEERRRDAQGLQNMRELNSSNIVRHLEQAYMRGDRGMFNDWMREAGKWQVDHPGMMPPQASFGRELETHMRQSAYARGMGMPVGVSPRDIGARGALRYGNIPVQ